MDWDRQNYSSGAPLEEKAGYSRAVKIGPFIFVGGTTSVQPDGSVLGSDNAYEQAKYILKKQIKIIEQAGGSREEIFRVKCYSTDNSLNKEFIRAYSELLKPVKPLCTVVGTTALTRPGQFFEVEMEACLGMK